LEKLSIARLPLERRFVADLLSKLRSLSRLTALDLSALPAVSLPADRFFSYEEGVEYFDATAGAAGEAEVLHAVYTELQQLLCGSDDSALLSSSLHALSLEGWFDYSGALSRVLQSAFQSSACALRQLHLKANHFTENALRELFNMLYSARAQQLTWIALHDNTPTANAAQTLDQQTISAIMDALLSPDNR
jgi:hypothetical protein